MADEKPRLADVDAYRPQKGDEFVRIADITPEIARERTVEIRLEGSGEGFRGKIADATHYLSEGVVFLRLWQQEPGIFDSPDKMILIKAATP